MCKKRETAVAIAMVMSKENTFNFALVILGIMCAFLVLYLLVGLIITFCGHRIWPHVAAEHEEAPIVPEAPVTVISGAGLY
ncbi:hypothetical protein L596_000344 [Steinernema carpocapsae]|uniref:Uncharacterized protein n=1 Tax=Steinernema carpocapsae TaxID=34508 RepID=A0A4U8UIH7_STECR|nr:hypothetical protein L596_000344 [Steinernema carpocapsae]